MAKYMKGAVKTDWGTIFMGLLAVSAVLIALGYLGILHVPGQSIVGAPQPTITVSGSCPDTGRVAVRLMGISSVLTTTGTETPVNAVAAGVELHGSTSLTDSITLSNTAYVASTVGHEIPCGENFNILFPSTTSTAWYNELIPMQGASAAFIDSKFVADPVGTIAVTGHNSTSTAGYTTGTLVESVPVAATDTGLYLQVKENTGAVYRGPLLAAIAYDTINYTDIEVIGATQVSCPSGLGVVTDSNGATTSYQKCFTLAVGDLKNYAATTINLKVVTGANVITNVSSGSNWTVTFMDYGARVKNGAIISEYRNSDTGGTIGAADVSFKVATGQPA